MRRVLPLFGNPFQAGRGVPAGRAIALCFLSLGLALTLALGPGATPAHAQIDGIGDPIDPGPAFLVSQFVVRYLDPHPDQPPLDRILPLTVRLSTASSGFIAPSPDRPQTEVRVGEAGAPLPYHASAIGSIGAAVLAALQARGLLGVYVEPDPADVDIANERDLRPPGVTVMRLIVTTARVRALRTIASGDRVTSEWRIDNEIHDRIRRYSPIQPTGADSPYTSDLVDGDVLDEYLFRLNRHPGRRVDAALAPAADGQGVSLDYLVSESKPWYVYAQVSNTGTDATNEWQQRFGYVNNQLLDRDDSLAFEYFRAGLDDLNGVNLSYEAPWFDGQRPWWWSAPKDGPGWLSWLDRSRLPWFGSERLRWNVFGAYTSYSLDVALPPDGDPSTKGKETLGGVDWNAGGRLIANVFQHRAFFFDVFGGLETRGVEIDNDAAVVNVSRIFVLPQGGIDVERVNPISTLVGNVTLEGNVKKDTDDELGLEALGRADPDDRWMVLKGDLGLTAYLEPIFDPGGWEDPSRASSATLAHELALGLRGQYAFGYRLIPQAEQVVGGLYSVRGYDQSSAVGDDVLIGSFEYRFHLPHSLPVDREPMRVPLLGDFRVAPQQAYGRPDWDLILRAFVDGAHTHANNRPDNALEKSQFLIGSGAGIELSIRNNLRARVDWAMALKSTRGNADRVDAGDHQLHFLFTILY
jgi:hypothetical protein